MNKLPLPCEAPGCWRLSSRGGKCDAHYMQELRAKAAGKKVRFTEPRTPPGEAGERIQLRPPRDLSERIAAAAYKAGLTVQAWILRVLEKETGC